MKGDEKVNKRRRKFRQKHSGDVSMESVDRTRKLEV